MVLNCIVPPAAAHPSSSACRAEEGPETRSSVRPPAIRHVGSEPTLRAVIRYSGLPANLANLRLGPEPFPGRPGTLALPKSDRDRLGLLMNLNPVQVIQVALLGTGLAAQRATD